MRYLPLTDEDRQEMLALIGAGSVDDLYCDVPVSARIDKIPDLPDHQSEIDVERQISAMADRNLSPAKAPSFLGGGAYRHHIPASVDHLIQRGEFLTAYTPYQPEVSQGTLQMLFEFQTQVAMITGMDVANASLYDGATACSEAVLMATRVTKRRKAILSGGLHPHFHEVTHTGCDLLGINVLDWSLDPEGFHKNYDDIDEDTACVVVQYPDVLGRLRDLTPLAEKCHANGALLIVALTEIVAMGALKTPGAMGADIVVGEGQSLGVPLSFGGPYLGLFACRHKHVRQMPGRLAGETVDAEGRRGFVLTLSTREQHIRREKATSNICTNSGLCALAFSIHLSLLGDKGFRALADLNHARAVQTAEALKTLPNVSVLNEYFFNEFTVRLPISAQKAVSMLAEKGILAGVPLSRLYPDRQDMETLLLVAATECNTENDIQALTSALGEVI